jgi:hypothetical protein
VCARGSLAKTTPASRPKPNPKQPPPKPQTPPNQNSALLDEREALEAEAAALSGLPADQQRAVASGFREYIDTFKAFVRAKMAQQQQEQQEAEVAAAGGAGGERGAAAGAGGGDAAAASAGGGSGALTITAEMVAEFSAVVRNAKRARVDGGLPNVAPKG